MHRHGKSMRILHTDLMRIRYLMYQVDFSELGNDLWRQNPVNKHYDYKLIHSRLQSLMEAQENGDVQGLMYIIRSGKSALPVSDIRTASESWKYCLKEAI